MQLIVIAPFDWAHQGVRIEHFPLDAAFETEDGELIEVSTREKWARPAGPIVAAETSSSALEPDPGPAPGPADPGPTGAGQPEPETPAIVEPAPKSGRGRAKQ